MGFYTTVWLIHLRYHNSVLFCNSPSWPAVRCWWRTLQTKYVYGNYLGIKCWWRFLVTIFLHKAPKSKFSHQRRQIVTNIESRISQCHQQYCRFIRRPSVEKSFSSKSKFSTIIFFSNLVSEFKYLESGNRPT